jgi:hypothetical protein
MDYPDKIERVILHLEKENGVPLSEIEVGELTVVDEIFKMKAIYFDVTSTGNIVKGIYETSASFYIYIRQINPSFYSLKIYFKPEQYDEVVFFITRLKKKQNARTNS